jgi:transcription elongation factor GreA
LLIPLLQIGRRIFSGFKMTTVKKIQITERGLDSLEKELTKLVETKRPRLVERLSHARDQGDLAENSDYNNAKDELEFLDGRIAELKEVLKNAIIIKKQVNGQVGVGVTVTLTANGKKQEFHIVGDWEADPASQKISHQSPLGMALVGKKVGDEVEVEAPAGKIVYKIISIS